MNTSLVLKLIIKIIPLSGYDPHDSNKIEALQLLLRNKMYAGFIGLVQGATRKRHLVADTATTFQQ
jgi:hypothetical protein